MELKASPGRCEEASILSGKVYIPCNAPAANMVGWPDRGEKPIRMCEACTWHNVRNRGATVLGSFEGAVAPEPTWQENLSRLLRESR